MLITDICSIFATASRAVWGGVFKEHYKTYDFPPSVILAKLQVTLRRDNLQAPDVSLANDTYYLL